MKRRLLSREEILEADDRPAAATRRQRPPKWRGAELDLEVAVAAEIELLRRRARIAATRRRTPAGIFVIAGDRFGASERSARRYFAAHREAARAWADYLEAIPKRRARFAELVTAFGPEIGRLPATTIDMIIAARESATVRELVEVDQAVRDLLARTGR